MPPWQGQNSYHADSAPASLPRIHRRPAAAQDVDNRGREDPLLRQFDVVIERDSEGDYAASVPQIPTCHTQVRSLGEVTGPIREAIALCLEVEGVPEQEFEFLGIQRVTIAA